MKKNPVIVWFRHDLRSTDNPALTEAVILGHPVLPVFIWAPQEEDMGVGAASRWWLHYSLLSLQKKLTAMGSQLIIRSGPSKDVLLDLVEETKASHVFWNRRYEPRIIERDTHIKASLSEKQIETKSFKSALLFEPWQLRTGEGKPYQVYTRFWEKSKTLPPHGLPFPTPDVLHSPDHWPESNDISSLKLLPTLHWAERFSQEWTPGEEGAEKALKSFLSFPITTYQSSRDIPSEKGTSRLAPHLHFGEISPRQIWYAVQKQTTKKNLPGALKSSDIYLKEICWREFAHHLLYEFPHTVHEPLRPSFKKFPWVKNPKQLHAWQQGKTGYPIVDAGMRELWATGWMHNRVRMIVASFLVKHLRISWTEGAAWFWDTLVDADLANNTLGWQWSAGCGADAAPYFRIFNPVLQGEKFDAQGTYVKTWVPELNKLPPKWIHQPWKAPADVLKTCDVQLGQTYPHPVVDHPQARQQALADFQKIK